MERAPAGTRSTLRSLPAGRRAATGRLRSRNDRQRSVRGRRGRLLSRGGGSSGVGSGAGSGVARGSGGVDGFTSGVNGGVARGSGGVDGFAGGVGSLVGSGSGFSSGFLRGFDGGLFRLGAASEGEGGKGGSQSDLRVHV